MNDIMIADLQKCIAMNDIMIADLQKLHSDAWYFLYLKMMIADLGKLHRNEWYFLFLVLMLQSSLVRSLVRLSSCKSSASLAYQCMQYFSLCSDIGMTANARDF